MELQQMRYALAIAEEQSFTRAAERCFVVQSALSRQIKSLESELGLTLFARTSRKVKVTPAGEAFLEQARLCLQAADRAKVEAAAAQGEVRGTLTIGVIPTVTAVDVAAVLGQFHRRHPDVRVHVRSGGSDAFLHRIADGRLDAAFLGLAEAVIPQDVRSPGNGWWRYCRPSISWRSDVDSTLRILPTSPSWTFQQDHQDASSRIWPFRRRDSAAR